jgi:tetratricopeptide (TPR) repeat protein
VSLENHAHARSRKHPFDHAFAVTLGAQVFDFCNEPERLLAHAREGEEVGREHSIQIMSEVLAEISKGIAKLRMRDAGAAAHLEEAAARLDRSGQRIWGPYVRALRGEALARAGDPAAGLAVVDEVLADIEARHERVHLAEVLRLRGWILLQQGESALGEATLEQAIAFAQEQESRSWELRATTTLARHLAVGGRRHEAHARLEPIYGWFTEGFSTHDLKEAKALLDELAD